MKRSVALCVRAVGALGAVAALGAVGMLGAVAAGTGCVVVTDLRGLSAPAAAGIEGGGAIEGGEGGAAKGDGAAGDGRASWCSGQNATTFCEDFDGEKLDPGWVVGTSSGAELLALGDAGATSAPNALVVEQLVNPGGADHIEWGSTFARGQWARIGLNVVRAGTGGTLSVTLDGATAKAFPITADTIPTSAPTVRAQPGVIHSANTSASLAIDDCTIDVR